MRESGYSKVPHGLFAGILLCVWVLCLGGKAAAQQSTAQKSANSQAKASDYAGSEACKACHADEYKAWENSPHWNTTLNKKEGPSHQGCEACHGGAAVHVADPTDVSKLFLFTKATTKEINERCLVCHASGTEHMQAIDSLHTKNDVSCTSCHSIHHSGGKQFLLVKAQPELCYSCHLQQKPQFQMPFHHRVNEGLVQCTDCHNPHGTGQPHQLRVSTAQDAVCFKCHADKQGPFVFEHEVVKVEGCKACHSPHGSPNPHLLKVSNINMLCLQCHTTSFANAPGAPSFHNQAAQFQACTLCHTQIHGSNFDRTFFK
ncbi:MAG TPA: DmsE family decaheme c-type cytochrome [Candidatus Acidoferrales bacterium]|nr:DmsE family decaheme c-type cytochrome [Candidatus Acidoferrales bacterium]